MKPLLWPRAHALRPRSIAFRLIVAVLAVELLSSVLAVALSFGYERHIHFHAFDVMLHGHVDSIRGAVQESDDHLNNVMLVQADLHLPKDEIYEVYDANGRLLGRSPNWQGIAPDILPATHGNYLTLTVNNDEYRILRFKGSRLIDAAEPGGGKLRQFTILDGAPTEHIWHAIEGTVEFYAGGSLVLLLVTGPLIAWLLHRGLLPLRQLASLASGVSVNSWQFDPPASARRTPELAPLTLAIENVLHRLECSFLQQRAFVSDAAHELKTAVAVVKSSLQLLGMKPRTADEYKAGLDRCLADSLRLEEIVAKMLTLAREDSGAPGSDPRAKTNLAECLDETIAQLETVAALRQIALENPDAASVFVPLSAEDCSLLLSNLLLNAIQHSPANARVDLRLNMEPEAVVLEIEDHGQGIDPDVLPHVFDRFYRGDPSRARNTGGTGLGLAIAEAVAKRAGGSITLASQIGEGTVATIRLPRIEDSPAKPS